MKLHDYNLSLELKYGYLETKKLSFLEPIALDLSLLTQIYLKYHGFRFASMFVNFDSDLYLAFAEIGVAPANQIISHSVLLPKPIHIADIRFTLIPELVKIFTNHAILNGELILPKIREVHKSLQNAN